MDMKATVLAVDDQPTNLRLLDAVLTPRGHRVLTAVSGAEALALLETEDIDIVLLDILMPEMDGYEVCRRIRSTPADQALPRHRPTAGGRAGEMEHRTRVSGRRTGRRAGARQPPAALPVTTTGRSGYRR